MSGNRKYFVGGNWKMNGNLSKINELVTMLNEKGINTNTGKKLKANHNNYNIFRHIVLWANQRCNHSTQQLL